MRFSSVNHGRTKNIPSIKKASKFYGIHINLALFTFIETIKVSQRTVPILLHPLGRHQDYGDPTVY